MKKMLLFLTVASIGTGASARNKFHVSSEEMSDTINKLQNATIVEPPALMKKWHDLHAKKLELGAREVLSIAQQIKDPSVKAQYTKVAETKQTLARQMRDLPVPQERIKKSLHYLPQWKKLAAEKMLLESQQLLVVAKQTDTPVLAKVAKNKAKKADKILRALEHISAQTNRVDADRDDKSDYRSSKMAGLVGTRRERFDRFASFDRPARAERFEAQADLD